MPRIWIAEDGSWGSSCLVVADVDQETLDELQDDSQVIELFYTLWNEEIPIICRFSSQDGI